MDILTKYGMVNIIEAQVVDNTFKFDLEFRNAVLSRGMHHKVFWLCLIAQVTHVSCWETQKPHVHISWVCQSKPGGTGFWKPVGTVLCQQSQRLAVWISVAPVLETGGTGFTGSVTASFWEVGYLYPTTPSVACCCFWGCWCASLLFLAKPKPFLLSPTPLCEVAWSCEIFELGRREKPKWAVWEHSNPLSTVGHHQARVKCLLLLEVCLLDG